MSFTDVMNTLHWEEERLSLYAKTAADVERALARTRLDLEDFKALISPAAEAYLETMAQLSHRKTVQRFGLNQQLFAPLYLSNACANECTYCGFSMSNKLRRKVLTFEEISAEGRVLKARGMEHLLLVAGEAPKVVGTDYYAAALEQLSPDFAQLSLEVQPLEQPEYERLRDAGLHSVLVYQETYHRNCYQQHHTRGNKSDYGYRLDTPDRAGAAGIHKIGLGVLLGLTDWRVDSLMCAHHLHYLERHYWRSRFSMSFPRLRPAEGDFHVPHPINDRALVQLICAWRLFSPDLELTLSTRERPAFRDRLLPLGITTLSAASSTRPGGYSEGAEGTLEQFSTDDQRSVEDIVQRLEALHYQPVWKDWEPAMAG